jgi:hypothetical protein
MTSLPSRFHVHYVCASSYSRATKWTWQKSIERLEQTLKWRREFGIYDLVTADHWPIMLNLK